MDAVVELEGLSVRLGGRLVLDQLDCRLGGSCIGLLGPNGAGKTTLLHTLLGFFAPSSGGARVLGLDVGSDIERIRAQLGYMPEQDAFLAKMSAVRFVRLMAELSGLPPHEAIERSHEAFFYVGLGDARYRSLESYSLGMKQLVKLAQAMVHGPRLLLLDEPTNGLDPSARKRMLRLITEIRDSGRARIILSSHLLRDVEECCDEALILKDGKVASYCDLEAERRANQRFLEIEIMGDPEGRFVHQVRQLGVECATTGKRRLKAVLPESIEVRQLYEIAAREELQIRRLSSRRDSLETIFMRAMEGADVGV